ncbi:MAG: NADH-quinone oxidoreductase subunit NuoH [Phycisphaerales bacterium]|jgi:NADH-quinone oxidoreductase subunit H
MAPPTWLTAQLIVSFLTMFLIVHTMLGLVAYYVYFERKISAYIQDRIGPNRVGFDFGLPFLSFLKGCIGLGQPLADGIKFMLKEDFTPNRVDKILFTLAPAIVVIPALIGFIVIPWGGQFECPDIPFFGGHVIEGGPVHVAGANVSVGIVYLLAIAALGVYGVTIGGWASNNKFSFLGSLRASAQMISYEIPMGMALLAVLLIVGTLMPEQIIRYQVNNGWLILSNPLTAVLFYVAALAECNRAPFDNAECEQELVGGFHTEYSSMRFALYFLAEYSHLFTSAAFFTLLFLGGYHFPFMPVMNELTSPDHMSILGVMVKLGIFITKVTLIVCFAMLIRWTIPRLRYDQIMMAGWQLAIPLGLAIVVVTSTMMYFNQRGIGAQLIANVALAVLTLVFAPALSSNKANRRIPLYGSRFNPMPGERVITKPMHPTAVADHPGA